MGERGAGVDGHGVRKTSTEGGGGNNFARGLKFRRLWTITTTMKAILGIAVYLALVFALGVIMALPAPSEGGLTDAGDDDR